MAKKRKVKVRAGLRKFFRVASKWANGGYRKNLSVNLHMKVK